MTEDYAARVADDNDPLRGVLRAARAWGRPPSVFMGRSVVTTHVYDPLSLRLVRSETVEWTGRDLEMALALQDWEAGLCAGCGDPRSETMKPENQGRYVGKVAAVCHRCVAFEVAKEGTKHPHPGALSYTADLREPEPPEPT